MERAKMQMENGKRNVRLITYIKHTRYGRENMPLFLNFILFLTQILQQDQLSLQRDQYWL